MTRLFIVLLILVAGAGAFYLYKSRQEKRQNSLIDENQRNADDAVRKQLEDLRKPKN